MAQPISGYDHLLPRYRRAKIKDDYLEFETGDDKPRCGIDCARRAPRMTSDRRTLAQLRTQARQARDCGHYAAAARLERQAVELAGALHLTGERTQALLWEGYSLRQAGEDDLALAALLQTASERGATADPADVFAALIAIVHISLERKPIRFCRALLDQGRHYLADLRRPWTTPLDFLEGDLAYRRGAFSAAGDWHCRAWAGWRDEHPRLTAATHLWALCRVAFRRRDPAELAQLTEALADLRPIPALERQLIQRAQLLSWRARRATDASGAASEPAPVATALALLAETTEGANRDVGARQEALRVLALAGDWAKVDAALSQHPLDSERFETRLLLGDLALIRARAALGLPTVDDDYGLWPTALSAALSASATLILGESERYYQAALSLAASEDERLETGWHGDAIQERKDRLSCLWKN